MARYTADVSVPAYIDLPVACCKNSCGLAVDFGTSLIKVAYRTRDSSAREGEPRLQNGKERIRLALFARSELDEALCHILQSALVPAGQRVNITGLGSYKCVGHLEETLKIRTTILPSTDCTINGLRCVLDNLTMREAVTPALTESVKEGQEVLHQQDQMFATMNEHYDVKVDQYEESVNKKRHEQRVSDVPDDVRDDMTFSQSAADIFPCLLMCLGSTAEVLKICGDGRVELVGGSSRCGGGFMGLAHILTGAQSYEEVMRLATTGTDKELSTYSSDLLDTTVEGDSYVEFGKDDFIAFLYGKAVDKERDTFSKEGLARTLVFQYATDIAHLTYVSAVMSDVSRVFLAGNLCNSDVMRGELSKNIIVKGLFRMTKRPVDYQFLRHGGFLGAIGAFLSNLEAN